jgi:glycosyltransferase involved in cell wall biosynthesis
MNKKDPTFNLYLSARYAFQQMNFSLARKLSSEYQNDIDYDTFSKKDSREKNPVSVSVIIVAFGGREGLIDCLDSLSNQKDNDFEIILVDNGNNESIHQQLANYSMLHVFSPINFHWTEGRNVGAHFAKGKYLVFIDDDGLISDDYIASVKAAWKHFTFLAIRGRVKPKSKSSNLSVAAHYDYGNYPMPAILMAEGNMAIKKDVFKAVGGFDPLVLGGEGLELTHRLFKKFPGRDIYYWPGLLMYHDFVKGKNMLEKKKRHAITSAYFEYLAPEINELQFLYSNWYKSRPGESVTYDQRSFIEKLSAKIQEKAIKLINQILR